ncbi:Protein C25F9.2 protein, partial [Aphelenchoides avenae]
MSRVPANTDRSSRKRRLDEPHLEEEELSLDAPFGMEEEEADDDFQPSRPTTPPPPRSPSPQPGPSSRPDPATDDELERYFQVVRSQPQYIRKFNIVGYQTCFHIDPMAENMSADQQYALFLRIAQRLIDDTIERAQENGHVAHRMGFAFRADGMKKSEYLVPFRSLEENNAEKLGEEVYNFEQSAGGVQVIGNNCWMKVTVCRRTVGAGKKDSLRTKGEQVNKDPACLPAVSLSNRGPDNLCLFKAIAISKYYEELKEARDPNLKRNIDSFREDKRDKLYFAVAELMSAIDLNIREVDMLDPNITYVEEEMAKLQEHFDVTAPGRYRIVVFSQYADTHPIWKGPNTAKLNICIYHYTDEDTTNGHYEAVKSAEKLFARGKYCHDCEVTYARDSHHSAKCKSKCINCLRVGYGFPCNGTDRIHCPGCNKIFTSRECYEKHHEVACRMYKKCETCGKYWRPDVRKPKKGEPAPPEPEHQCELPFCRLCRNAHRKEEPCFVSPPRLPTKETEYRIISWDYECQVHRKVDNDTKTLHEPNYVVALVTCSKCIREDRWKDLDRADCEICGPQKVYAKGEWECPNGLTKELVDWFLQLPKEFKTYAYSHNGAHYDDNFVMQDLYGRPGLKPKILSNGNKMFE